MLAQQKKDQEEIWELFGESMWIVVLYLHLPIADR